MTRCMRSWPEHIAPADSVFTHRAFCVFSAGSSVHGDGTHLEGAEFASLRWTFRRPVPLGTFDNNLSPLELMLAKYLFLCGNDDDWKAQAISILCYLQLQAVELYRMMVFR